MILLDTQKEEFSKLREIRVFGKDDEEVLFNGDLLVIGLGGIGRKVLTSLKGMLRADLRQEDNINYLLIDSDIKEMEETIEDSKDGNGLNALEVLSIYRPNLSDVLSNGIKQNPVHPNLANWMREDFPNVSIDTDGAKGNRQIGRLMFSNAYEDVRVLLFEKLADIYSKSQTGKLDVILVSSVAGGTGSGILSDVAYNIKAYAKAKKWTNFRIGGCLLLPDVLFANKSIADNKELVDLYNANGCATLKEVDFLMRLTDKNEAFSFESTSHRIIMRENIFDACMLISGKKDEQGYLPDGVICSDVAYFIAKLSRNKYIGCSPDDEDKKLLRDSFFDRTLGRGYYKVVNESDYKVPIKEIENICEYTLYKEANKRLHDLPNMKDIVYRDMRALLLELNTFFDGKPGDEIKLDVKGLISVGQFERPDYKSIKKNTDSLRNSMSRQLKDIEQIMPVIIKSLKNKLNQELDNLISKYMNTYGPFLTIEMIGAAGFGGLEVDDGMILEIKEIEKRIFEYQPTGEYSRIIESIRDMVSKKLFAFPSAKRETERGYYDACIKETLATERTLLIDGMNSYDLFGDIVRLLRQKAERFVDIYAQFGEDLGNAIEDLANNGKRVVSYILKDAKRHEFLPLDYITDARINEVKNGIIGLMVNHEADIDNGRVVPIKEVMEKIYKNTFVGVGVYAPEKLISVAFAEKEPTLQEANVMFVSGTNEKRDEIMNNVARSFVAGIEEKQEKKNFCNLKEGSENSIINKKYISLPAAMPHFSDAVKKILLEAPYNTPVDMIAYNRGELEISVDDIYLGIPLSMLENANDMQDAYNKVDKNSYYGLHVDEVNIDMYQYPDIC